MRLYVDDIRREPDSSWTLARTINSALNCIVQFSPTTISLDHDISCESRMKDNLLIHSSNECFCAVALFIGEFYKGKKYPNVILHTANPNGADKLREKLNRYGIITEDKFSEKAIRSEM